MPTHAITDTTSVASAAAGDELSALAAQLRGAADASADAARRLVPPDPTISVCRRYRTALAGWQGSPPPSYERLADLLAQLDRTAAAARLSARHCDAARRAASGRTSA